MKRIVQEPLGGILQDRKIRQSENQPMPTRKAGGITNVTMTQSPWILAENQGPALPWHDNQSKKPPEQKKLRRLHVETIFLFKAWPEP
jgi:hypothetical protein